MSEPLITVCIPTYEPKPEHLREAIRCVLSQTESRWQLIIHDDASATDVRSIVEPFLNDPRITFHRSKHRRGIGGNWNAAATFAKTPYVQFLFQDDTWTERYLERALHMESNPSVGIVSMGHHYSFEENAAAAPAYDIVQKARAQFKPGFHDGQQLLRWWIDQELTPNIVGEPSFVMIRRSVFEQAGPFAEDLPQFLDAQMWIRCLLHADWFAVREDFGFFRVHPSGASARNSESGAGIYDRLQTFERFIAQLPQGELRDRTIAARNRSLTGMAKKFLTRILGRERIAASGSGAMRTFARKHPLLVGKTIMQAVFHL